ncbi:hypothetical protein CDL12_10150 [Handroanthus impetiginosus]|uniref:Uncharacterized protein n=1 Tax=Handroanthus impetiginosus TaxID=429701 RepID=A0A2G9HI21_9LAMI|nr:hypothetical protein CDL12_10150 [Handroanthus impetiginosus]
MLTSQGLFLAVAVSAGTIILFDLFKDKYFPSSQNQDSQKKVLKSCLSKSTGNKKREKEQRKKVHFADEVKDFRGNGRRFCRKGQRNVEIAKSCCGNEVFGFKKMPANRVALYSGIMKDRMERMEYSY